jgi:hypothetical protein
MKVAGQQTRTPWWTGMLTGLLLTPQWSRARGFSDADKMFAFQNITQNP